MWLGEEGVDLVEHVGDALGRRFAGEKLAHHLGDASERLVEHGFVECVLRREVVQHGRFVRAGGVGDLLHGDRAEAPFGEELRRRIEHGAAPPADCGELTRSDLTVGCRFYYHMVRIIGRAVVDVKC